MDKDRVLGLAKLARIEMSGAEADKLSHEFDAILNYVSEVKKVSSGLPLQRGRMEGVYNILREDGEPHDPGIYTESILSQAPAKEGDYLKVKKIL